MKVRTPSIELVLIGGGHAHVQVLRRLAMSPIPQTHLTVVLDEPNATYSGMVPGYIAGDYQAEDLQIDVVPLSRRARARVVLSKALSVNPVAKLVEIEGRPPLPYDIASMDVGSSVRNLDLPGVRRHALITRPIGRFVKEFNTILTSRLESIQSKEIALVVVGGGAAGIELAFTLGSRLETCGLYPNISIVSESHSILATYPKQVVNHAMKEIERRDIKIITGQHVSGVESNAVLVGDGKIGCDLVVWATGAAPPPIVTLSDLPKDEIGFVRVNPSLQVEGFPDLFAVGDCASLKATPRIPKAGVYAVRQGPILIKNLRAHVSSRKFRNYRPQSNFLSILNLGGRKAVASKWRFVTSNSINWRIKDWIDRRFMRRFQVLGENDRLTPGFPSPEIMGMEEVECGGCASKLGASPLESALARLEPRPNDPSVIIGLDGPDDAAVLQHTNGAVTMVSIDAFRSFSDDPWLVGRVAAVNAMSDLFATGGIPKHALALVTLPSEEDTRAEEILFQVLAGARAAFDPLEVSLVGGHTTRGPELFVGFSVDGVLPEGTTPLGKGGLVSGNQLILTKALGTGVLLAADMKGLARGKWLQAGLSSLVRDNASASMVAREFGIRTCTDISGFGLAGHLLEMLRASEVAARIDLEELPALPGALSLLKRGFRSTYHDQNESSGRKYLCEKETDSSQLQLLFDPQTSGGLLFSAPANQAEEIITSLKNAGEVDACRIGEVIPWNRGPSLIHV